MTIQMNDNVELGQIKVSNNRATVYEVENIGTSVAVVVYDMVSKVGGVAHIVLPESSLAPPSANADDAVGRYADLAIPALLHDFSAIGGQKRNAVVRMVGGAQLFNFGGGGGNILNIGARNATAIQAALASEGLAIDKADTGGNKAKGVRLVLLTGQLFVSQIGGEEYML